MRYVNSQIEEDQRELAYRIYVTDCLRLIPQNKYIPKRFADILPDLFKPRDNRPAEVIALDVMEKAGLRFEE